MVLVFTREAGKISAGTHISERSKGGAALAIRPFAHGQYAITEKRAEMYSISKAEIIDSFFGLGGDPDRFAEASWVLEFTDKLMPEGAPEPVIFDLLSEYLSVISVRKTDFRLLTIAYIAKVMLELGVFPEEGSYGESELLSGLNDDILNIIAFIEKQPFKRLENLKLDQQSENAVFGVMRAFAGEYIDFGKMKSDAMFVSGK